MTENIPPVPPAPQPPSYPVQGPFGPVQGNEPPYGPPQTYAQQAPPAFGQAPYGQPPYASYSPQQYAPQWQTPAKPKMSGLRIAAGIICILLGVFLLLPSLAGLVAGPGDAKFLGFLVLLASLGNITSGILLLINQRNRSKWAPVTSLSTAGFALFLGFVGLMHDYYGVTLFIFSLLLAAPVLILLGIGLALDKKTA
ncbi:hypothetical protein [Arthrobacter sp. UYCo732]|uniref:hypothetical protein n=1 Tax=Arthrobacter sp. UYCo732 TaxID=3156336 RepID=UPI0033973603